MSDLIKSFVPEPSFTVISNNFRLTMKLQEKGAWKAIPMPHSLFSGGMDSAVCGGIEVLDDYTISKGNKIVSSTQAQLAKSGKSLKRKNESVLIEEVAGKKKKLASGFVVTDIQSHDDGKKSESRPKSKKKKKSKNKPAVDLSKFNQLFSRTESSPTVRDSVSLKPADKNSQAESLPVKKSETLTKKVKKTFSTEAIVDPQAARAVPVDVSEWKELFVCEEVLKALADRGFSQPTPIQRLSLPSALKGVFFVSI